MLSRAGSRGPALAAVLVATCACAATERRDGPSTCENAPDRGLRSAPDAPPAPEGFQGLTALGDGSFVLLPATAELCGRALRVEGDAAAAEITGWMDESDFARWTLWIEDPGAYDLELVLPDGFDGPLAFALEAPGARHTVEVHGAREILEMAWLTLPLTEPGPSEVVLRLIEGRAPALIVIRPTLAW